MYLIFAASVPLSFLGLLLFVLVLLLVWLFWLWCLVRCGFWGSLVIRHEIRINSNLPGFGRAFLGSWCNCARLDLSGLLGVLFGSWCLLWSCARLAVVVLLSQDLNGLQRDRVTG